MHSGSRAQDGTRALLTAPLKHSDEIRGRSLRGRGAQHAAKCDRRDREDPGHAEHGERTSALHRRFWLLRESPAPGPLAADGLNGRGVLRRAPDGLDRCGILGFGLEGIEAVSSGLNWGGIFRGAPNRCNRCGILRLALHGLYWLLIAPALLVNGLRVERGDARDHSEEEARHIYNVHTHIEGRAIGGPTRRRAPVFLFRLAGVCASPRQSAPLSCQCAVREACILRILFRFYRRW